MFRYCIFFAVFTIFHTQSCLATTIQTNQTGTGGLVSVQEILINGPTQLKFHSLMMIRMGKVDAPIDSSYLPGLKKCAESEEKVIRSNSAQIIGEYFVQGKEPPDPEAVEVLINLAKDRSDDVRYAAIHYGLTQITDKSEEIISLLIAEAARNPKQNLYERIIESLKNDQKQVKEILEKRLTEENNVAIYEIYADLTGEKPAHAEKYLDMPSSRPHLFIVEGTDEDADVLKEELNDVLQKAGGITPDLEISATGDSYVLLLKTYIVRDYETAKKLFSEQEKYSVTQEMWLTPELQAQLDAMKQKTSE